MGMLLQMNRMPPHRKIYQEGVPVFEEQEQEEAGDGEWDVRTIPDKITDSQIKNYE